MRMWLKTMRNDQGLTQKEVAEKVGILQQTYNYIETGKRRPSVEKAKKIAEVLGFDWTLFYQDEPQQAG